MSLDDLHSLSDFEYPQEQPPAPPPSKKPRKPEKPKKAKKADNKAQKADEKADKRERSGLFGRRKPGDSAPAPEVEARPEASDKPEALVEASPEALVEASPEALVEASPEALVEVASEIQSPEPVAPAPEPAFVRQAIYLDAIPPIIEARPEPIDPPVTAPRPTRPTPPPAEAADPWYRTRGWRVAGKAVGFLLALLWLVLISGTLVLRTFGYEPLVVQTSSMEPTVDAGDLMISTSRTEPVEVGQIYIGIAPNTGLPTAHRVTGPGPDPDCWLTKGDNNDAVDPYCLTTPELDKQIVGWIPYGGFVNNFLSQPLVRMMMFVAPLLLFLPPIIRAFRTQKKSAPDSHGGESDEDSDEAEPVGLQIGNVDKVVSLLVALAIFGLLGARLYFNFIPIAIGDVAPEASLAGGSMAMTQPKPVSELEPGDIILVVPPEQSLPSLQQVIVQEEDPTLLPPEPGNVYLSTVDAVAPAASIINRMQLQESGEVPQVVFQIPRLGGLLPVLATTAGFAGLMVLLGLFATVLLMRVLLSTGNTRTRQAPAGNVA